MSTVFYRAVRDIVAGEPLTGDGWAVIDLTRPGKRVPCTSCGIAKGVGGKGVGGKQLDAAGVCADCRSSHTRYVLKAPRQNKAGKPLAGETMNAKGVIVNYDLHGGGGGFKRTIMQYEGCTLFDHDGTTVLRRPLAGAPAHDPSRAYARGDVVVEVAS